MLLGILSDTHGHTPNAQSAARMLESFAPAAVLHCGDIGDEDIPATFATWPTHYVLGNVDDDSPALRQAILAAGGTYHGRFGEIDLDGRRIALLHGDDAERHAEAIVSQRYDLICSGHTHRAEQRREGRTLVLNPGALFRARQHTIAIVDLMEMTATHVVV